MRARWLRIGATALSLIAAGWLIAVALPAVTGVSWTAIVGQLTALSALTLLWLAVIWLAGLWAYTYVLTGSLPGLTHTQALILNCAGSAVSNTLPFGGAAGTAVTVALARSWGHRRQAVTVSILVSGTWNLLSRLALPAIGLTALMISGYLPDRRLAVPAVIATALLACTLTLVIAGLASKTTIPFVGRVARLLPARAHPAIGRVGQALSRLKGDTIDVIQQAWGRLTLGIVGYLGLQYALFWSCLAATSTHLTAGATVAAFALSRLLTIAAVTPSGVGIAESGTAVMLVALGAPAVPATGAVVLFGFFSYAMELPAGGIAWLTWAVMRQRRTMQTGGAG